MLQPRTTAVSGYLTLYPPRHLGEDLASSLYRVGIRQWDRTKQTTGYALRTTRGVVVLGRGCTAEQARLAAARECFTGPVEILLEVARGRSTLYRRVETVDLSSDGDSIDVDGQVIEKETAFSIEALSRKLSGQLRSIDRERVRPLLDQMLQRLDVDWSKLDSKQISELFKQAGDLFSRTATERALPQWTTQVQTTLKYVADKARAQLRDTFIPRIGMSFTREESEAIGQIGTQQGWFLRDSTRAISEKLTERGRSIVEDGLRKGLGREEIGSKLWDELPGMWGGMGKRYADVIAANAVSRARSWAEVVSYQEAGIELLEVVAMLDERTTDICRCMDGQVIQVSDCAALCLEAARVENPQDIYETSPFMKVVRGEKGNEIRTQTGTRIAEILRSGVGILNDRGQMNMFVAGRQLPSVKIGMPPYHHYCRTLTAPRVESFQIPAKYEVRAQELPAVVPKRQRPKPVPQVPPGLMNVQPGKGQEPQRPLNLTPQPTPENPTPSGVPLDIDRVVVPEQFMASLGKLEKNEFARVRAFTRAPSGTEAFVPGKTQSIPTSVQGQTINHGNDFYSGVLGTAGSAMLNMTCSSFRERDLAAIASNPGFYGRQILMKVETPSGIKHLKISQSSAPSKDLNKIKKEFDLMSDKSVNDWLAKAQKDGWLKVGLKIQDVSSATTSRVTATTSSVVTKPLPAAKPLPALPPPVPSPPLPKLKEVPPQSWEGVGLRDHEVKFETYASRPKPEQMAKATWEGKSGLVQKSRVKGGEVVSGEWSSISRAANRDLDVESLKITKDDALVTLFVPEPLYADDERRLYLRLIKREIDAGYTGSREYIIHDSRGATTFIRYNGSALNTIDKKDLYATMKHAVSDKLVGSGSKPVTTSSNHSKALKQLENLAQRTNSLQEFYPKAAIDWSQPTLIPGVPVKEQMMKRVAAVKAELEANISSTGQTKNEIGDQIWAAMKRGATNERPTQNLAFGNPSKSTKASDLRGKARQDLLKVNREVVTKDAVLLGKSKVKKFYDEGLKFASDGLLSAASSVPLPTLVTSKDQRAFYTTSGDTGGASAPGVISIYQRAPGQPDITHELCHHIETLGMNHVAIRHSRNAALVDETKLVDIYGNKKEFALKGRFVDTYSGKLYGSDLKMALEHIASGEKGGLQFVMDREVEKSVRHRASIVDVHSEYFSKVGSAVGSGNTHALSKMWEKDPDQVALYISVMRGHYVPY